MTKIFPPHVFKYVGDNPEDWGISGVVFIAESHIAIHTFVERSYINIDLFSCKEFDSEKAIKDFIGEFELTHYTSRLVNRDWSKKQLDNTGDLSILHTV
jgi:S-adenosylmethionine decarboxylase